MDDALLETGVQASPHVAVAAYERLVSFLVPLRTVLDAQRDKRLARTLLHGGEALRCWRNQAHGLLLSELGAYLLTPAHAPAGTKRLSCLLGSPCWSAEVVEQFVWQSGGSGTCWGRCPIGLCESRRSRRSATRFASVPAADRAARPGLGPPEPTGVRWSAVPCFRPSLHPPNPPAAKTSSLAIQ